MSREFLGGVSDIIGPSCPLNSSVYVGPFARDKPVNRSVNDSLHDWETGDGVANFAAL